MNKNLNVLLIAPVEYEYLRDYFVKHNPFKKTWTIDVKYLDTNVCRNINDYVQEIDSPHPDAVLASEYTRVLFEMVANSDFVVYVKGSSINNIICQKALECVDVIYRRFNITNNIYYALDASFVCDKFTIYLMKRAMRLKNARVYNFQALKTVINSAEGEVCR